MKIKNRTIRIKTSEGIGFHDITEQVRSIVSDSGILNGLVSVFVKHTTAGVRVNENEKLLLEDIRSLFEKIASKNCKYRHDNLSERRCPDSERINGHSHLKSLILNTTETIPVVKGIPALGRWQSILFVELDGSRNREIFVQVMGE